MRHGSVNRERNASGQELIYSPSGKLAPQAQGEIANLATSLRSTPFDAIYTSTTPRAETSATLLLTMLEQKSPRFTSFKGLQAISSPSWVGKPVEGSIGENGFYVPNQDDKDDESPEELSRRIWESFTEIVQDEKNEGLTIGIMGHSEGIGVIMHKLKHPEDPEPKIEESIPPGSAMVFDLDPITLGIENERRIPEIAFRGIEGPGRREI